MSDFWTDDKFEECVTKGIIALYETKIERSSYGRQWSQIKEEDLARVRRKGLFIPAPDRIWMRCPDPMYDLPSAGCFALTKEVNDPDAIQSYCRINYFKRIDRLHGSVNRFGPGVPYQLISLFPQSTAEGMFAARTYFTVPGAGHSPILAEPKFNRCAPDERMRLQILLGVGMFLTTDARNQWTVTAHTDVSTVSVGAYAGVVKSLLYARELPVTASGRKRPILHLVDAHKRRIKSGIDINVKTFLRGTREIEMNGMKYTVQAPQRLIEELAA